MNDELTPTQIRKLKHFAEVGETRDPGNITTTMSLVTRGLVEAEKIGTFPHTHMLYRITEKGRESLRSA